MTMTPLILADVADAITRSSRCKGSAEVHPAGDGYGEHVEYSEAGGDVTVWPEGTLAYRGMVLVEGLDTPEAVVEAIADVEASVPIYVWRLEGALNQPVGRLVRTPAQDLREGDLFLFRVPPNTDDRGCCWAIQCCEQTGTIVCSEILPASGLESWTVVPAIIEEQ